MVCWVGEVGMGERTKGLEEKGAKSERGATEYGFSKPGSLT
jgi:hypothetical protein